MRLLYLANIRLPTEKAHGVQIMKMCAAFTRAGIETTLAVSDRKTDITEEAFAYYGMAPIFRIVRLRVLDWVHLGPVGFMLESVAFALSAARYVRAHPPERIYGRDHSVLWILSWFTRRPIVWESHTGAWGFAARRLARKAERIVVITDGLRTFYVARGVPEAKLIVAHDGIDPADFVAPETKEAARARLGLPRDARIALYIGRIDGWKGADTLCRAAALLPDALVAVIGGEPEQVRRMQAQYPQVRFLGYRPYRELKDNQAAADVLVLPNTARDLISVSFTSPLKLFSYLAAERPIVASDLPSLREILSEDTAYFFTADEPASLADAITRALQDPAAIEKARATRRLSESYTWDARARSLIAQLLPAATGTGSSQD